MAKLNIETHDRNKPILLVAGDSVLTKELIKSLNGEFKVALISDNKTLYNDLDSKSYYRIDTDSAYLVKNLEEKVDYAVIVLENSKQRKYIPHVIEKLTNDGTKIIIVTDIDKTQEFYDVLLEYKSLSNLYFYILGDLYDERESYGNFDISKLIHESLKNHYYVSVGDDLTPIYPIYLPDALKSINHLLFGPRKTDKFYSGFYSHPESLISAIHILKRIEPELEIQYKDQKNKKESRVSHQEFEQNIKAKLLATPVHLDKFLSGFEASARNFTWDTFTQHKKEIPKRPTPKRETKKHVVSFTKSFFIALALYVVLNTFFLILGVFEFKAALDAFKRQDYQTTSTSIKRTKVFLDVVSPNIVLASQVANLAGIKTTLTDNLLSSSSVLAASAEDLETIEKLPEGVDRQTFQDLISNTSYIYFSAQKLQSEIKSETLREVLSSDLSTAMNFLPVAEDVLGFDREKKYLLLFQNNGELRPTGGFIGSVGEITLSQGKMVDLTIQDVYEYDGKLKAHIEPHYIIRRFLQPHLYLRDSNFSLNFQESAEKAAQIYNLETGRKVDGVIAVNYDTVKEIIKVLGPINLPAYDKQIDENSAFEFLQSTIDESFFPGSTAKKDVLTALFNQISLKAEDRNNMIKIAKILPNQARSKNILFAFTNPSTQAIFSTAGFGGTYDDARKTESETVNDFFSINEANIGVNKVNTETTRETAYAIDLTQQTTTATVFHTINNNSTKDDYSAYIRVFVPKGSVITTIKINGINQTLVPAVTDFAQFEGRLFKAPPGLELDSFTEGIGQTFGFRIIVPKSNKQVLEISFENGISRPTTPIINYSLLVFKQPGIGELPFTLITKYPEDYSPAEVKNASLENGTIQMPRTITTDEVFEIKLVKS